MRGAFLLCLLVAVTPPRAFADDQSGKERSETSTPEVGTELVIRLGNESNANDGVFGPVTYGIRAAHAFASGFALEGAYIRLHEPGTPALSSALDEAVLTVRAPAIPVFGQSFVVGATGWRNRTSDMYTTVGGLELTRSGTVSVTAGVYTGKAARAALAEHYVGFQLLVAASLGRFDLSGSYVAGRIGRDGTYRRGSLEAAVNLLTASRVPLAVTLAVEDRFYSFGAGLPKIDPGDEWIFVLGAEVHLEKLLFQ